jgi:hypothetical protein
MGGEICDIALFFGWWGATRGIKGGGSTRDVGKDVVLCRNGGRVAEVSFYFVFGCEQRKRKKRALGEKTKKKIEERE